MKENKEDQNKDDKPPVKESVMVITPQEFIEKKNVSETMKRIFLSRCIGTVNPQKVWDDMWRNP